MLGSVGFYSKALLTFMNLICWLGGREGGEGGRVWKRERGGGRTWRGQGREEAFVPKLLWVKARIPIVIVLAAVETGRWF